jgi:hypothetical protein
LVQRKKKISTRSTPESELLAASDETTNVIWSREFLNSQGYVLPPTTIYLDNKSTIMMITKEQDSSSRARHIHIRYYFIKDKVDEGLVRYEYVPSNEIVADIMTKPLQGSSNYALNFLSERFKISTYIARECWNNKINSCHCRVNIVIMTMSNG